MDVIEVYTNVPSFNYKSSWY